jgi:hypothetical protein
MSTTAQRIKTMRALVAGAQSRSGGRAFKDVDQELQEVGWSHQVSPDRRRHLLQVFHGMRALESGLKEVLRSYDIDPGKTLGDVLHKLRTLKPAHPLHQEASQLHRLLRFLLHERNRLMHQANAFPRGAKEADRIFGEICACFTRLVK